MKLNCVMVWEKQRPKSEKIMYNLVLKRKDDNGIRKSIPVNVCGPSYSDGDLAKLGYKPVHEKIIIGNDINSLENVISEFYGKEKKEIINPIIRLIRLNNGYNAKLYSH